MSKQVSNKLLSLNLKNNSVSLKLTDTITVSHYNGDYADGAYEKTNFLPELTSVISQGDIRKKNSLLDTMRDNQLLDDYERGTFKFSEYVLNKISDNRWDYVNENLEMWDNKRGSLTLSCEFTVPVNLLVDAEKNGLTLGDNWTVYAPTDVGLLEIER